MSDPIASKLAAWYRSAARDLPWRRTRDPYRIWVSEIMLQQTRVDTVIGYYQRFLETFPTVEALAEGSEELLLKRWEGLGYYRRARNLRAAAKRVVSEWGGVFPATAEGWQELPGIGRYTSAAIASIAFGERVAVLDGNVKRVLARLDGIANPIDKPETEAKLWERAESLVPAAAPGDHNQAMMELGATICLPKNPLCPTCPLQQVCRAFGEGLTAQIPVRTPKKAVPHRNAVAAVIRNEKGEVLIWKRPSDGLLGGMWELPGGEIEKGEARETALARHLSRELQLETVPKGVAATAKHTYSHFTLAVTALEIAIPEAELANLVASPPRPIAWLTPGTPSPHALHRVHQKLLEALADPQQGLEL